MGGGGGPPHPPPPPPPPPPQSAECVFETPAGCVYDLSPLRGRTYQLASVDGGFRYTLRMCEALGETGMSPLCTRQHPVAKAASAVQEAAHGESCFYLNRADAVSYHSIDPANPHLGLDVVYGGGQPCADGRPRELRLHFVCAGSAFDETRPPHMVIETPERCHYNVSWPSVYACPRVTLLGRIVGESNAASLSWLLWVSSVAWYGGLALYCFAGCTVNVWRGAGDIGWSAMPHRDFWTRQYTTWVPAAVRSSSLWSLPGVSHVVALLTVLASIGAKLWQWGIVSLRARAPWLIPAAVIARFGGPAAPAAPGGVAGGRERERHASSGVGAGRGGVDDNKAANPFVGAGGRGDGERIAVNVDGVGGRGGGRRGGGDLVGRAIDTVLEKVG
jgi:hypothetical protein